MNCIDSLKVGEKKMEREGEIIQSTRTIVLLDSDREPEELRPQQLSTIFVVGPSFEEYILYVTNLAINFPFFRSN